MEDGGFGDGKPSLVILLCAMIRRKIWVLGSSSRSAIESSANAVTTAVNKAACMWVMYQPPENRLLERETNKDEEGFHAGVPTSEHTLVVFICEPNVG